MAKLMERFFWNGCWAAVTELHLGVVVRRYSLKEETFLLDHTIG